MSNHSKDHPYKFPTAFRSVQEELEGTFPEGKMGVDDEGALALAVTNDMGKVVVSFAHPVEWFAAPPENVRELCELLLNQAKECDGVESHVRRTGGVN